MPKPTQSHDWANAASGSDMTAPSSGQIDAGWSSGSFPPHNWFNWWMNKVDLWIDWLRDYESTAHTWTALQTFSSGVSLPTPTPASPSGYSSNWSNAGFYGGPGIGQYRLPSGLYVIDGSLTYNGSGLAGFAQYQACAFADHPSQVLHGTASITVGTGAASTYPCFIDTSGNFKIVPAGGAIASGGVVFQIKLQGLG